VIKKFESFSIVQDVMDLRSFIEDEFPDLEISEVTDVSGEIPGGLGSRCPNPISFKIKFWGPNSKLTGKDKCEILLKICDIIDFFERSCDGLKFEFSLLWDVISLNARSGEWYDIKTTNKFRDMILSGEFTNPIELTLVFSSIGSITESIDFGSLGDVFHPLEDDWNVEILITDGLEMKLKVSGESGANGGRDPQISGKGETFRDDPCHFYFYQEGGTDVGFWQTFTDGSGYDVMGSDFEILVLKPTNNPLSPEKWYLHKIGKISFNYDLVEEVLSGVGDNFTIKKRNEYTLIKIEVLGKEFFNSDNLIRDMQSKIKMAVNMYGLELFNTKDPYYRNGIFGAVMTDKKWEVNWLTDELDSKKIWNELKDDMLSIRVCFKK